MANIGLTICFVFLLIATSSAQEQAPEITPEIISKCESLEYCEHTDGYPKELVENLVRNAGNSLMLNREIHVDKDPFESRRSATGPFTSLCSSVTQTIIPTVARTKTDTRVWVVNLPEEYVQTYTVQYCKNSLMQACSPDISTQPGYDSVCTQKYTWRYSIVLEEGGKNLTQAQVKLPSCCQCEAHVVDPLLTE